jgi:hypothetical protein
VVVVMLSEYSHSRKIRRRAHNRDRARMVRRRNRDITIGRILVLRGGTVVVERERAWREQVTPL